MQQADFEAELKSSGYTEIESRAIDSRPVNHGHTHEYDIRGLVLDGVFIVNQGDEPVTYRAGEIFDVPAGRSHTEEIGRRVRGFWWGGSIRGEGRKCWC